MSGDGDVGSREARVRGWGRRGGGEKKRRRRRRRRRRYRTLLLGILKVMAGDGLGF